nr:hypothetical protein [uncultured Anaeromusa sp.]
MAFGEGDNVFHIVIPESGATHVTAIVSEDKLKFKSAWEQRIKDDLTILNTIEGWMIFNENWYARPSIFASISNERLTSLRVKIIEEMNIDDPRRAEELGKMDNINYMDRVAREEKFHKKLYEQCIE